ncbi:hypothetical protein B296_00040775 [Ensete ventricosum]|uniref:Uncharacterized protein n=1 Tax=Ensete ventricosum TaxID=4639 RepID=A0A426XP12_ENSVE|nr:hypothetical protein B296_00040775 [Ensete ventricosum]
MRQCDATSNNMVVDENEEKAERCDIDADASHASSSSFGATPLYLTCLPSLPPPSSSVMQMQSGAKGGRGDRAVQRRCKCLTSLFLLWHQRKCVNFLPKCLRPGDLADPIHP